LGAGTFERLARDYAESHTSRSPDLNLYDEGFSGFVGEAVRRISTLRDYEYLQDLCMLEGLWHAVYYRQDDDPFDFSAFATCSSQPGHLKLIPSHSLELMVSNHPVHLIWLCHREQRPPASVPGLHEPEHLCIYRKEFVPVIEPVDKPGYDLLNACKQGYSLDDMAADRHLSACMQELPAMIQRGWISSFSFQPA